MRLVSSLLCASLALAAPAGAATVVNFAGWSGDFPANAVVYEDFEDEASGDALGTRAFVYSSSVSSYSARPAFGSAGNFGAVWSGGAYATSFAPTSMFAFVLGSLDTYNSLTLSYEDSTTATYNGGQIINGLSFPSGNQISGLTNGVVSYTVTDGPRLTGATFRSSGNSFEFDNLAVAAPNLPSAVPEPATWAMMIGGFGLVGVGLRRRKRSVLATA